MRPYILAESHWPEVRDLDYQLAILPWGATEAHNYHLPYGTDNYETDVLVQEFITAIGAVTDNDKIPEESSSFYTNLPDEYFDDEEDGSDPGADEAGEENDPEDPGTDEETAEGEEEKGEEKPAEAAAE